MNRFCSRILKSINMDHIGIVFALRVVFAVKIWEKTSMIVWTTLCGPDYHTLAKKTVIKTLHQNIFIFSRPKQYFET
mgnify:CR=1 FL=1